MNTRAAIEKFGMMADHRHPIKIIEGFAESIRDLVGSGQSSWEELGFTDKEVEKRLHEAKVRDRREKFELMARPFYSAAFIQSFADDIRGLVESGESSWDELRCTDALVARRLRKAYTRDGLDRYEKMADTKHPLTLVQSFADDIREWVRNGKTSWKALKFTNADVKKRLRDAKARDAAAS